MEVKETHRGFAVAEFKDRNGVRCSIQKSSSIEPSIWLGTHIDSVQVLVPNTGGWKSHSLEDVGAAVSGLPRDDFESPNGQCSVLVQDRMHLSQEQVRELLPLLQHFAETGELHEEMRDGD